MILFVGVRTLQTSSAFLHCKVRSFFLAFACVEGDYVSVREPERINDNVTIHFVKSYTSAPFIPNVQIMICQYPSGKLEEAKKAIRNNNLYKDLSSKKWASLHVKIMYDNEYIDADEYDFMMII